MDSDPFDPLASNRALVVVPPCDTRTWVYDRDTGARIADLVAAGVSIHHQRADDPLAVPPPSVVFTWKKQHPEFGVMLAHADKVRADLLMEQALMVADTGQGQPARVAIQVAQRMKMAERLDPSRFGTGSGMGQGIAPPSDAQPLALEVSDEQLAALALSGAAVESGPSG